MKTNAITRIIIWSIVVVILIGMLVVGIYRPGRRLGSEAPAATEAAILIEVTNPTVWDNAPETCDEKATVTAAGLNVRSAPATDSPLVGMLEEGDVVRINRGVSVNGKYWLGIYSPIHGWIAADYVDNIEEVVFYSDPDLRAGIVKDTQKATDRQAFASDLLPVYSAPSTDSTILQDLSKGTAVAIGRQENVAGQGWTYITFPTAGWVLTDLLQETEAPAAQNSEISLDAKQIREIDIEWAAGTITVEPAAVDTIQVTESEPAEAKYAMVWKQTNDKLVIRFCENTKLDFNFGITINDVISKDLTVLVPMGWECDSLKVDAASAALNVKNLAIREVDFDGASGTCSFENCVINELDLDTASGDIRFTGSLDTLDCDAASASVTAVFDNIPQRIDMDSMSGDLDITLPSSAGFTVSMDALSSDFYSDFDYFQKNGCYYYGNGDCKITLDAMSGDLYIREFKEADAAPAATAATEVPETVEVHHHTDTCTTDPESCPDNSTHHTEAHHE